MPDDRVAIEGASSAATEVLARWGDGSVRWLLVEAVAESALALTRGEPTEGPGVDAAGLTDGLALDVDGARADLAGARWRVERETPLSVRLAAEGTTPGGLAWRARVERAIGAPDRLRLSLGNPRPTTVERGQPTCLRLGCPGTVPIRSVAIRTGDRAARVRWAKENGAATVAGGADLLPGPYELRPGERWGWEIVLGSGDLEPAILEFPAHWGCATGALGPLAPFDLAAFGDYERNNAAGARGLRAGRARPHWRNPRDHGEDQRDWDGGDVATDWQTHNNEYDVHLAYAKQRIRTMGLHEASRDWHYLGVTGTRHFANVDIYHVHEGPLPWMHGAPFQHVKHGGSGRSTMHRSEFAPNVAHLTGRGLLAWWWLTGDPELLDAFREVVENARWRVANGPGGPGYSNTTGEERAPAMALGLLTDAWVETRDAGVLAAAKKVVEESHARTKSWIGAAPGSEWRCKPWMVALLAVALEEFVDAIEEYGDAQEAAEARESLRLYQAFLASTSFHDGELTRLPYQVASDPAQREEGSADSWNVVAADALVGFDPTLAAELYRTGARSIWYPDHPVGKYATLLSHGIVAGWGHRTMSALEGGPAATP